MNANVSIHFAKLLRECLCSLLVLTALSMLSLPAHAMPQQDAEPAITFKQSDGKVDVRIGDSLFTTLDYQSYPKPILHPIYGPGQVPMTRNWPMKKEVAGEAHDHPHHKSMWISHEINEIDFWTEKGNVETTKVELLQKNGDAAIRVGCRWINPKNKEALFSSTFEYRFGGNDKIRWIDCKVDFHADVDDITFEDTKEGMFAIRTHPDLRLKASPKHGVKEVYGSAFNSEGTSGKAIWGKKAKWLVYQGKISGDEVSVMMLDHPDNLRHPTTWHARDYGLVAANPFGLKHFQGAKDGAGAYTIKKGGHLKLRYRIELFEGIIDASQAKERFDLFAR